jgi:hypothetical protein
MNGPTLLPTTPAYHPGPLGVRTAFVLAVPGSKERDATRPAAGDTGDNLDRILVHLHRHDPAAFPSTGRYDYRIVNAWETIMFGTDSMPDLTDVCKSDNVARLAEQLAGIATIVALSVPAIAGVEGASIYPTYRHTVHPSMRGLNNYYSGLGNDREGRQRRVEERCQRYADEVIVSKADQRTATRCRGF